MVLAQYMEAIIVDSVKTAWQCVQYLKDQKLNAETFMPLDNIQVEPLNEQLRNIKNPPNVELMYDILQYDLPEIKQVVLFATNNTVVCETVGDAVKMINEMENGHR